MNGRAHSDPTPEGRIAAIARSLALQLEDTLKRQPDYADYRDALRPYVERELLLARIDEARKSAGTALTERILELVADLRLCEEKIPVEFHL